MMPRELTDKDRADIRNLAVDTLTDAWLQAFRGRKPDIEKMQRCERAIRAVSYDPEHYIGQAERVASIVHDQNVEYERRVA